MTSSEQQPDRDRMAAALAAADRQHAHVVVALDEVVMTRARELAAAHDPTGAWALLARYLRQGLGDSPDHVGFLAELLAAAALRELARESGS